MKCFYHSADLDGHCSGALIKRKYPECEMIGIDYGNDFPWSSISKEEMVFMVDFSLQPFSDMRKLRGMCNLIWIDHHVSAIKDSKEGSDSSWCGLVHTGTGACALVWKYLYSSEPLPTFVQLLAEYDVWNHSDSRTMLFQYGMRLISDTLPNNQGFWEALFDHEYVAQIVDNGATVLEYQQIENRKYIQAIGFECMFDGFRCIAVNRGLTNSKLFDSVWDPKKYDIMLTFYMISPEKGWIVSLYTDKPEIDVSVIAKKHGGGGHKGASGFQCYELPFIQMNVSDHI